jgi:hypothetical protein
MDRRLMGYTIMAFKMLTLARERQKLTSGLLCKMSTPIWQSSQFSNKYTLIYNLVCLFHSLVTGCRVSRPIYIS